MSPPGNQPLWGTWRRAQREEHAGAGQGNCVVISTYGKVRMARVGKTSTWPRGAITGGFLAGFCKGSDHRIRES